MRGHLKACSNSEYAFFCALDERLLSFLRTLEIATWGFIGRTFASVLKNDKSAEGRQAHALAFLYGAVGSLGWMRIF
ncbi:hypothetical protein D881_12020 [Corynebacterium ulcerans NCTC 12077]|nr:hypothetical protein D881_12020 [Corynebacterium ulcerans NCTC 12077]